MRFALFALVAFVAPSCYESTFLLGGLFNKNRCLKSGQYFNFGRFEDPSDSGVICDCSYYGRYTCRRKECPPATCGTALQTISGSCVQCAPQCATTRCPDLKCPVNERFYPPSSCCHKCYDPKTDSSDSHSSSHHDTSKTSRRNVHIHVHAGSKTSDHHTSKSSSDRRNKSKTSDHHTSKSSSDRRNKPTRYRREDESTADDEETHSN